MAALGALIIAVGMCLVGVEAVASYFNQMFWPSQIIAKWGQPGIAFVMHMGMWSDGLILAPVLGTVVARFGNSWNVSQVGWALLIGFGITLGNHINLCLFQKIPDPMGWQGEWWSTTIALHFIYMWGGVTIVMLFYLFTSGVDTATVIVLTVFVGIHMTFGTHIPLGVLNRFAHFPWCPEFLTAQALGLQVGIWATLGYLAWYAAGAEALVAAAATGTALVLTAAVVATQTNPIQ